MKRKFFILSAVIFFSLAVMGIFLLCCSQRADTDTSKISSEVSSEGEYSSAEDTDDTSKRQLVPNLSAVEDYDSKYLVKKLGLEDKYYFCEMYRAVAEHRESYTFDVPINENRLKKLMYLLNYECPELIYLKGEYLAENTGEKNEYAGKVNFSYCMTQEESTEAFKELNEFFKSLISETDGMNEFEKEKYVYDYIFMNCSYNDLSDTSGSAYGSLIAGAGRCEAYCKGFMWCMRKLGTECICVSGYCDTASNSVFTEHSWNLVKIDNNWYHLDISADNVSTVSERIPDYGFFNVSDVFISEKYQIDPIYNDIGIPACTTSDFNYHTANGLFVTAGDAKSKLQDIMLENFDEEGISNLSVKFESRSDYNLILNDVELFIKEFLKNNSDLVFEYSIRYNDLSKTILINLKKAA